MKSTWDTIRTFLPWVLTALTLATAVLSFLANLNRLPEAWNNVLKPLWKKVIAPLLKVVLVPATLVIPNGLIIGFTLYQVATYYFEEGSLDFIITNPRVFFYLVGGQALLVSLYSFLWTIVAVKTRAWLVHRKSDSQTPMTRKQRTATKSNQKRHATP